MGMAGVTTIEPANPYLTHDDLAGWERARTVEAAHSDEAPRPLDQGHHLAASLSPGETRPVRPDYSLPWEGKW